MKKMDLKKVFRGTAWFLQLRQKYPQFMFGLVLAIGTATLGIALSLYAYVGTFTRYHADDYCMSNLYLINGFPKSVVILYQTWSNRYAGMILISISEMFGRSVVRYWPLLTLVLWVLALTWALLQAGRLSRLFSSRWLALVMAGVLIFFTVMESPHLFQTVFWRVGVITYTLPLVFLAALTGLVLNGMIKAGSGSRARLGSILGLIGCFAITLFAGGLSETYVALQTVFLGMAILLALVATKSGARRSWLLWLGVSLAGSLVSLLIVLSAPGNAIRQANMPPPPGLWFLVRSSAANAFSFIYLSLRNYSFQTLLLFLLSLLLAYGFVISNPAPMRTRPSWLVSALLLAPVIGYLLIVAMCAPSMYAESSYPEPRALMGARFIVVLLTAIEGLLIGIGLGQLQVLSNEIPPFYLRASVLLVSIVILLYPLYDARKVYRQIPDARAIAAAWDARDAQIRAGKTQDLDVIVVQEFDSIGGLQELRPDENFWVNGCAARFYGVPAIEAIEN